MKPTDIDNPSREFYPNMLMEQVGKMNILAISGGRVEVHANGIVLPIRYGYKVEIFLADNDTYTVQRTLTRKANRVVKGEMTDVYFTEVGEVAYRASIYRDPFGN